ncbi:MAG: UvrD-helicase domain-containing protein [Proteobacteria bacterium]|nr:UvrD-helicase domain-containing protein [Pseudomonadota bacterium]
MTEPRVSETAYAYELNGQRVSRPDFYAVACDPRRSVAVEACAGAGKTWMLVSRMLRALLAGAQPHEILAITFTKKAAGEMRQRLQQWLQAFAQATPEQLLHELHIRGVPPQAAPGLVEPLRGLYRALLQSGRPVQVRTFHSWFAALLRNAPLAVLQQLGLPASYELLEDDKDAVDAVWRHFHAAVVAQPEARRDYLDAVAVHGRFNTLKALEAALAKRVEFALADARGTVDASVKPFGEQFTELAGLAEPAQALQGATTRSVLLDAARVLGTGAPTYAALGSKLEQAVGGLALGDVLDALFTQKGDPRKFGKLADHPAVTAAQALAQRLQAAARQHAAWQHQQRMARLTRLLIAEFSALKRERGWVDMNDVERAALVMLSDPVLSGWVQERLDARVGHLLIDEFQDTNPLQWQALHAWLSGYAGAGGQAPSVFVVGDPKQSIYRFRRAEPQVFRAAQRFVVQGLGGDLLSCDHTHRNAQRVLAAVNQAMGAALAAGEYDGYRAHTTESPEVGAVQRLPQIERAAQAAEAAPDLLAWRNSLTTPRELPEDSLRTLECRQAARWIAAELAQGRPPGDIMVLARKREPLSVLQDELRALHIAAVQPEKKNLADAPEVQDVVALLDALVSPAHDLSLARALKSPLFGLPDSALAHLAGLKRAAQAQKLAVSWYGLLQQGDAEGLLPAPLAGVGAVLARWQTLVQALPPHDALDAIFHHEINGQDLPARFAAAAPAPLRASVVANLGALLGAALQIDGARFLTPYALVRALRAGGAPAPALAGEGTVRLLTVHGAKGLEAPLVLMLDTDAESPKAETMGVLVEWPGEDEAPRCFTFLASESRPPACTVDALAAEQTARQREELNALYVAMTRAREVLVLSSTQPHRAAPASWWQRLLPLAEPVDAPAQAVATATPDAQHASFVMQKLPPAPEQAAASAGPPEAGDEAADEGGEDTPAARLGQAMHRLLEWWVPGAVPGQGGWPAQQRLSVQREFALGAEQINEAAAMAQRILAGDGAWAWDRAVVDWQGNEVLIHHAGEALRLDRLVHRRDTGEWWVLDHKSEWRPELKPGLQDKMNNYRAAVQAAYPQAVVRAAYLTAQGKLVNV